MNVSSSFWSMFLVVIQLGAILAVVLLYWNKIFPFRKSNEGKYVPVKSIWILWSKILVATIPAAVIGLLLDDWIDAHLYNGFVVAIMLILVGVAFIYVENRNKDMTFLLYLVIFHSDCSKHPPSSPSHLMNITF
jgi:undecaprenyl-diphosphatase